MKSGIWDLVWQWSCNRGLFGGFASNYREIVISKRRKRRQICWRQGVVVGVRKKMEMNEGTRGGVDALIGTNLWKLSVGCTPRQTPGADLV